MTAHTTVVAHHAYEPQRDDELKFDAGDIIQVTDSSDPDWWIGKKDDGTSGFFPSNFVNPKQDTAEETNKDDEKSTSVEKDDAAKEETAVKKDEEEEQQPKEASDETEAPPPAKPIGMARVMEDYAMQESDELTLHRGAIVTLYERLDDGWYKGELNGRSGRFPGQYIEEIDMPGAPEFGAHAAPVAKTEGAAVEGAESNKPAFKLAAYGVKQGGIGSLLAGGFPTLKKTGAAKKPPVPESTTSPTAAAPAPAPAPVPEKKASVPEPAQSVPEKKYIGKAIVLHPYDAENEDELSLLRGEYVSIIDKEVDDGWWKGTTERGNTGVFPSNFVKEIEEETMASPPPVRTRKSVTSAGSQHSFSSASSKIGATVRAPPLPDKSSRPPSTASTTGRPESVHETTSATDSPAPIPEEETPSTTNDKENDVAAVAAATQQSPPTTSEPASATPAEESEKNEPTSVSQEEPKVDEEQPTSPPVPQRPTSITSPSSVTSPAIPERPSSGNVDATTTPSSVTSPSIPERPSSGNVEAAPSPSIPSRPSSITSDAAAAAAAPPSIPRRPSSTATPPPAPERRPSSSSDVSSPAQQSSTPAQEQKESPSIPEEVEEEKPSSPVEEEPKDEAPSPTPASKEESPKPEAVDETPKDEPVEEETKPEGEKPVEEEKPETAAESPKEESVEEKKQVETTEEQAESPKAEEHEEEEKKGFDMQPTGPKLTAPSRARPGRTRRAPETRKEEPSQMEMLQQQLAEEPVEEEQPKKEAPSPPAKPVKPIFAKFPTPFAGGAAPELKNLKPVQRRMFEPAPAHESTDKGGEEPPRPTGVRNIASRFNVPSSGGNEVLETKMKNFTKNEIEKTRKDLERQLEEEREKRAQLEQLVASLAERVDQLQSQLGQ
ncbi:hypothetical protein RO3G_06143 [Lichtheimia corymbifera JMRC:FSU:9682]|uniref:SH3 domain-containing protein n=1 Tax=Lichtheimia corymbifera JMRC:FSU:9682 TaxID=1263082 RepID=A0A068SDC1_9FUNG|nr:hypothetical protein RO3G_06143 [Lichtheimia corymbifera JMRC:FSU:9682]